MNGHSYTFQSTVWLFPGQSSWHFANLPQHQSTVIKELFGSMSRGWRSLPVVVTAGKTSWKTSIFPDKKSDAYLLPLKVEVRKKEGMKEGDTVTFKIEIQI